MFLLPHTTLQLSNERAAVIVEDRDSSVPALWGKFRKCAWKLTSAVTVVSDSLIQRREFDPSMGTSLARLQQALKVGLEMKINPLTKAMIGLTAVGAAGAAYVLVQKKRHIAESEAPKSVEIHGFVNSGYEATREAFAENFSE